MSLTDETSEAVLTASDSGESEDGLELATSLLAALDESEGGELGRPESSKRKREEDALSGPCRDQEGGALLQPQGDFKRPRSRGERDVGCGNHQEERSDSPLRGIPPEVVLKILSCLSAADLVQCQQVCKAFWGIASDDSLWRRLYLFRWGQAAYSEGGLDGRTWKTLYGERDAVEMEETVAAAPVEAADMYSEMQRAKRHKSLGVGQYVELALGIADIHLVQRVSEWLKSHGFPEVPRPKTDHCLPPGPYVQIGDAFICEKSGYVHICGESCRECVVDPTTDSLVCPISGRSVERMITEWEENQMMGDKAEDGFEEFNGRLGRAYAAGYNCSNEYELRRVCGVKLS
eukprot:evm.model.scf_1791.1 EVM.evm.TU.scf_1791.1   scf_1791:4917-11254(-)